MSSSEPRSQPEQRPPQSALRDVNARRRDGGADGGRRREWGRPVIGRYVAGLSKVSALSRTTEVATHREVGDPSSSRKALGRAEYEVVTLEGGVTHDTEFEVWANKVWNWGSGLGSEVSLQDFRKDLILEICNEAGQLAIAYKIYRCSVSEYQALPEMDANAVAIQTLKLEDEGYRHPFARSAAWTVSGCDS